MNHRFEITKSGVRSARKLLGKHPELKEPFEEALETLRADPFPSGYVKLTGKEAYRLAFERDYRIIYTFDKRVLVLTVVLVADRKEVYRQL